VLVGGGMVATGYLAVTLLVVAASLTVSVHCHDAPVIGIFDQPLSGFTGPSYIAASYVKYLESSGARVVPLHYRSSPAELQSLVSRLNGVLFTGGGTDLRPGQPFFDSAQVVYDYALAANARGDVFPLWGTCMGFQLMCILAANDPSVLASNAFDSYNLPIPITPSSGARTSRLLGPDTLSDALYYAAITKNITMNNHHDGVYPDVFARNSRLNSTYNVLSTNVDRAGRPFISTIEAKSLPFYAVQWHPEKNPFEWTPMENLPHSAIAVQLTQAMSNFFVNQCRLSSHTFLPTDLTPLLIYNDAPVFTGAKGSDFTQEYQWK